jgi:hypothetical protein
LGQRLQLQGELQTKNEAVKKYKGVLHGVKVILQNEGPRGLFRGIGSAVCDVPIEVHLRKYPANLTAI